MDKLTKIGQTLGAAGLAVAIIFAVNGNAEETIIVTPNEGAPDTYVVEFKTQVTTSQKVTIQELQAQLDQVRMQMSVLAATEASIVVMLEQAQEAVEETVNEN